MGGGVSAPGQEGFQAGDRDALRRLYAAAPKIICVGRNYREHAAELNNEIPAAPFFFLKPPTALHFFPETDAGGDRFAPLVLPLKEVGSIHHEVELGLVVGRRLERRAAAAADAAADGAEVCGLVLALDLTARELQERAKQSGMPWTAAKGYDGFMPTSEMISCEAVAGADPPPPGPLPAWASLCSKLVLELEVNGERRQFGRTDQMIFDPPALLAHIRAVMTLNPGDIILTGTPAGVGPLNEGDRLTAALYYADGPQRLRRLAEIKRLVVAGEPA